MASLKGATKISLNERFTQLRSSVSERDHVSEIRQSRYDERQASIRSQRVQMQMEQRPGVRAALARVNNGARSRSRSRSRNARLLGGPSPSLNIRDRLSLRMRGGRGRGGFRRGGGGPAVLRRSRSRSRNGGDVFAGGRGGARRNSIGGAIVRGRSRSRSRSRSRMGRFIDQSPGPYRGGRGGYRGGARGRRARSTSRSRVRNGLKRMGSTGSLNSVTRGGGAPRGRVRRDSITNGIQYQRGGGVRGREGARGRGRGGMVRARGRSRSIRDVVGGVGKFDAGLRGDGIRRMRGRGGSRGRRGMRGGRGRGGGRGGQPAAAPVSKDELDKQLDQYMATDPLNLDKDLEAYKSDM